MSRASRRRFLVGAAAGTAGLAVPRILRAQAPAVVTAERRRPLLPSGIMAGDIDGDRAVIWSRSDRPAQMLVEWSTTEAFRDVHRVTGEVALPESDHTARVELAGLPQGQTIFYRVQFQDVGDAAVRSEVLTGRIVVPAREERRDVTFVFSGDEAGQGWGINPERGGYRLYEAMRRQQPDFFIHSGDQIYADGPLQAEVKLDDGTIWKNVVTEAKSKVCETVADFRGAFAYNLMDENKRRFAADVPFLVQWDDHEVRNNWFPGQTIGDQRYQQRDASLLAARARRAMFDFNPIRRDPFDPERLYRSFAFGPGAIDPT
ncbi:MAG: alkaline phosphatase D family protein, partial [Ferrovibrionaceae bacterium]